MQSSYRRGLISISLDRLAPIGKLASSIGLSGAFDRTADFAVRTYQKHLSPRKGFSCAYARLHGGPSCSAYFRKLLTTEGFSQAIKPFQHRLQECHQASLTIRASRAQTIKASRMQTDDDDEQPQRKRKNPNNSGWCETGTDVGDAGNCWCDIFTKDIGNCDTPDCGLGSWDLGEDCDIAGCDKAAAPGPCDDWGTIGGCDFGACDAGGCDGCDAGGCDCGF